MTSRGLVSLFRDASALVDRCWAEEQFFEVDGMLKLPKRTSNKGI
jgi:hypothetical protein